MVGSARRLDEVNISPKFYDNPSRRLGVIERTRNIRLKPLTLKSDLDLGPACLHGEFCTLS